MPFLQRFRLRGAFAGLLVLVACGGKQHVESTPSAAGGGGAGTAGSTGSAGTGGAVAQNGAPIPEALPGGTCETDADCADGSCVVSQYLTQTCSSGTRGTPCNLDAHCLSPARCIFQRAAFFGECHADIEGASCESTRDCPAPQGCLDFGFKRKVCSTQQTGSPCEEASHCSSGYCALGHCTSGAVDDECDGPEDCKQPYCGNGHCTSGGNYAECRPTENDCASGFNCVRRNPGPAECSDGTLGTACSNDDGEMVGCKEVLCTPGPDGDRCLGPRPVGESCITDAHCLSGMCATNVCTEGKLRQHCRPGQCVSGLVCASNGTDGICVAGVPGDPCTEDAACKSGTCGAPVMLTGNETMECAKANGTGPCGSGGACIFWTCNARRCQ